MADVLEMDLFKTLLKRAQDYLKEEMEVALDSFATFSFSDTLPESVRRLPPCGSPLEAGFEVWWEAATISRSTERSEYTFTYQLDRQVEATAGGRHYRFDFVVAPDPSDRNIGDRMSSDLNVPLPKLGIELDGHDFHEKTKEQVTYRNQRDRDLQNAGWRVFHFSGSEFVRHPQRCVEEVFKTADSIFHDYASALLLALKQRGEV